MDLSEMQTRVAELEQQISALPAGSVTKKTVNGKEYFYHRWTENKKRREKYIPVDELENFRAQIESRKELEQEMKALKKHLPKVKTIDIPRSRCLSCSSLWANLTWWCLTRRQAPAGFSRSSTARKLSRSSIAI